MRRVFLSLLLIGGWGCGSSESKTESSQDPRNISPLQEYTRGGDGGPSSTDPYGSQNPASDVGLASDAVLPGIEENARDTETPPTSDASTPGTDAKTARDGAEPGDTDKLTDITTRDDDTIELRPEDVHIPAPANDPIEPGPHEVAESYFELSIPGGLFGDILPLHIYLPQSEGTFPVVVFVHGFMLSSGDYASYGPHLASWGYAVVLPELPGSITNPTTHVELKEHLVTILDWIDDQSGDFPGPLTGKANPDHLGLAGHSMGGKISLLTASEDPRPSAIFGIDPVDSGPPFALNPQQYPSVTPERMDDISIPIALIGETVNATGTGQACAPADENFHQYYVHAQSPALEVEVLGANHMSFLDNPDCGLTCSFCPKGTDDPSVTRQLTQRLLVAFFDVVLKEESTAQYWLTGDGMAAAAAAGWVMWESKNGF